MADKKTVYIIVGVVCLVLSIPIILIVLGMIGGFVYYRMGAN